MSYRYFFLHKPYGVLSQFTAEVPGQRRRNYSWHAFEMGNGGLVLYRVE